eukprot:TRINITY_DN47502_c0_g1_i1.p1 TRINITY_DN47502_c0_g1~~TRINITY_DN47502_c0_g1_i1.p1  ORF type:complete len:1021 (-),score=218.76 TRINITY_DN47502_c0_g1_i1:37-3099(-)
MHDPGTAIDLDSDGEGEISLRAQEPVPPRPLRPPPQAGGTPRVCGTGELPIRRWGRPLTAAAATTIQVHSEGAVSARGDGRSVLAGWHYIHGDDAMASDRLRTAREAWRQTLSGCSREAQFEDADFPAEARSVNGRDEAKASQPVNGAPPQCRCGTTSKKSEVRKEGPTKGRPYWHCETRRCGFFAWADSEHRRQSKIWWQRFPDFHVVSDFGFRAEDLRQGGVGDCWFMSALAVVAERPDLILRLFGGETARNAAGCYQVNLFLDGEWQAVNIDDRLPCTDQQRRPDGSGLAFSRADGQQLWTPLLEKAYAKAHGSYKAISGGEIAEALLDLTGCPTESVDFDEQGFDPQELWQRLVAFKAQGFPMGCATAGNPELREVGLCGNHAYSILDVRELRDVRFMGRELGYGGAQEDGVVRLLRIRNPHGVGEWSGEWSDRSAEWTDNLASELGRTGIDDGTFWMDYTHFLMGFQVVDICMAHRGWHAESFSNVFCTKSSPSRLCKYIYELRCDSRTTLYAMALQPTKRGAWCRDDRKKSYKPGDISLFLIRLSQSGNFEEVIAGNFFCADLMARRCIQAELEGSGSRYALAAFSFGAGPVAHGGEARSSAPFKLRLFSSQTLGVRPVEAERSPQLASAVLSGLHGACLRLDAAPGRRIRRLVRPLSSDVCLFQVTGEGAVLLMLANAQKPGHDVTISISAEVKVMTARSSEGLLTSVLPEEGPPEKVTCFNCGKPGHLARDCTNPKQRGIRTPWRYPAKWRRVMTTCFVPAETQRIALAIIGNGMQAELGGVEVKVVTPDDHQGVSCVKSAASTPRSGRQRDLAGWLPSAASTDQQPIDAFAARPLMKGLVTAAVAQAAAKSSRPDRPAEGTLSCPSEQEEALAAAAAAASLSELQAQEERLLQQALAASTRPMAQDQSKEEKQLAEALAQSAAFHFQETSKAGDVTDQLLQQALAASRSDHLAAEDADLQAALLLSRGQLAVGSAVEILDSASEDEELVVSKNVSPPTSPEPKRHKVSCSF